MIVYDHIHRYPPILVRLLARKPRGRPLTNKEIAAKSGFTCIRVEDFSWKLDWSGIDIYQMRDFTRACGLDFSNQKHMRRAYDYLRKDPTFEYLRTAEIWKDYYMPMLIRWACVVVKDPPDWPPLIRLAKRMSVVSGLNGGGSQA